MIRIFVLPYVSITAYTRAERVCNTNQVISSDDLLMTHHDGAPRYPHFSILATRREPYVLIQQASKHLGLSLGSRDFKALDFCLESHHQGLQELRDDYSF